MAQARSSIPSSEDPRLPVRGEKIERTPESGKSASARVWKKVIYIAAHPVPATT